MAPPGQITDEDLIIFRVQARALAKRLGRQAEAGTLVCNQCGAPLAFDDTEVILFQCGHEVISVPCPTPDCPANDGHLFSPDGWPDHTRAEPGVSLSLAAWRRL